MKKFEENGFTATVTKDKVRWEIPISNLIFAFNNSPENPSEDGEQYITVKRGKRQEFAEFVAKTMFNECDQETGASYIEQAIDGVFREIFEDYKDFAKYPEYEED